MVVARTTISENGQVVIPAEIRREAGIPPSTKFIIFHDEGNIMLRKVTNQLRDDMLIIDRIRKSEDDISKGRARTAKTTMSDEEIEKMLMR